MMVIPLWVSLTKDEVKLRFEGEKDPPPSTFETPEYLERKTTVTNQYAQLTSALERHRMLDKKACIWCKKFILDPKKLISDFLYLDQPVLKFRSSLLMEKRIMMPIILDILGCINDFLNRTAFNSHVNGSYFIL
ncbi:MAG: hypothetical protein WAM14_11090 [Candidatus Nitrosopolaris sp.]